MPWKKNITIRELKQFQNQLSIYNFFKLFLSWKKWDFSLTGKCPNLGHNTQHLLIYSLADEEGDGADPKEQHHRQDPSLLRLKETLQYSTVQYSTVQYSTV